MYEKITRHTSQTKKAKYIKTNAPTADWLIDDSSYGIFAMIKPEGSGRNIQQTLLLYVSDNLTLVPGPYKRGIEGGNRSLFSKQHKK